MTNSIRKDIADNMVNDSKVRIGVVKDSFYMFFHFYFSHYVKYPTADFQREIMRHLEENKKNLYVVAFRNSAKSSIITTAFPVWSILGKLKKKFILIICQTSDQAKLHMSNLKSELENNEILKRDLGPFEEESDMWSIKGIRFSKSGAKIMIASIEQKIRGFRNNESRPDIIILDDIEDVASTRTRESRDKTYAWFKSELIPVGDRGTRIIAIGNLLHDDSLLKRIEVEIEGKKLEGVFMSIPIVDKEGNPAWIGKFPTKEDIEVERKKIGNDIFWKREYMLEMVPDSIQVIRKEWIRRYYSLPDRKSISDVRVAIDPATSTSDIADYSAIIIGITTSYGDKMKIYLLPNPINERMETPTLIKTCKRLNRELIDQFGHFPCFYVESVGMQKGISQLLKHEGIVVKEVPAHREKIENLGIASVILENGDVLFPEKGCEIVEDQIINFGIEKHDDLADAFSIICGSIVTDPAQYIGF